MIYVITKKRKFQYDECLILCGRVIGADYGELKENPLPFFYKGERGVFSFFILLIRDRFPSPDTLFYGAFGRVNLFLSSGIGYFSCLLQSVDGILIRPRLVMVVAMFSQASA